MLGSSCNRKEPGWGQRCFECWGNLGTGEVLRLLCWLEAPVWPQLCLGLLSVRLDKSLLKSLR